MSKKVAVVLGSNRGIGYALAECLASHWDDAGTVYVTARNESEARIAAEELSSKTGCDVKHLTFDLALPNDPVRISRILQQKHGGIDIVVQNGAYLPRSGQPAAADARPMIEANSHGTLRVLEAFTSALRESGQLVIVASALGVLENLSQTLRDQFNTKVHIPKEINDAIDRYVEAVESGASVKEGWPDWVNIPSKVAQVAVTRSYARWAKTNNLLAPHVRINAACPGVTLTDATREFIGTVFTKEEAQSPMEAAMGLMKLLSTPADVEEPYGELVQHGLVVKFGD